MPCDGRGQSNGAEKTALPTPACEDKGDVGGGCLWLNSFMKVALRALPSAHCMNTLVAPAANSSLAHTSSAARSTIRL